MFHKFAHYAFMLGILVAIIAALIQTASIFFIFSLALLGGIVGFLHFGSRTVNKFLIACIALLVAGSANFQILNVVFDPLGTLLTTVFSYIRLFVAPAALVAAFKALFEMASE
ncbi:hypothetical protein ACFL0V_02930 [Nanoarchaeota archaeon]